MNRLRPALTLSVWWLLAAGLAVPVEARQSSNAASPLSGHTWVRLGGPPGGLGYDIRVRPDDPDIWLVTDAFAGVHLSTDGGLTWATSDEGIDARTGPSNEAIPVFSLTIDPNNPDIVWAGTQGVRGIYRSTDGGRTWEKRVTGIREGITIRGLAVEPGNSDVIYAAGEVSSWIWAGRSQWGIAFDRTKGVIYKSTDAGQHWTEIWFGDDLARYVLIDPGNVNTLYASTGIFDREAANSDPATRAPGGVGVLKSTDGGATWRQINYGIENLYVGSLAMHPEDPNVLLAAAGNGTYGDGAGIYLTRDGGEHWQRVIGGGRFFMAVDFAPGIPVTYYATGGGEPFYRSRDEGLTWQAMTPANAGWNPPGFRMALPIDLQVDPRDPDRIFVNNYGGGNYLSTDGGQTWTSASTGYTGAEIWDVAVHPSNPAVVYANGRSGMFVSHDGGLSWQGINPANVNVQDGPQIVVDPSDPDHLLASEAQVAVLVESLDGGATWRMAFSHHGDADIAQIPTRLQTGFSAIAFAPSDARIAYGGLSTWTCHTDPRRDNCLDPAVQSLMVSEDGGGTWSPVEAGAIARLNVLDVAVHPADPKAVWLATGSAGVLFSADGGDTWDSQSGGLPASAVTSLALDPANADSLYAGTSDRAVYKSVDGGRTWQASGAGMDPNEPVRALVADPLRPNVLYAGSSFSGVYVSEDSGASWRHLNEGLRTRALRSLAISSDGETLYAATLGEGVFRLSTKEQAYFDSLQPTPVPTALPLPSPTADTYAPPITADGDGADWVDVPVSGSDPAGDHSTGSPDLGEIRAANDSRYFFLSIRLHETGVTDHYDVLLDVNGGDWDYQLSFWPDRDQAVFADFPVAGDMSPLAGVTAAQGEVIEVQMPLSAVGDRPVRRLLVQTFLGSAVGDRAPDLTATILSQATPTTAPTARPPTTVPPPTAQLATPTPSGGGGVPCLGGALPLTLIGFGWHRRRSRRA